MTQPEFIIERHEHGWLIKAPPGQTGIPIWGLNMCLPLFSKDAAMWPGIASATKSMSAIPDSSASGHRWESDIAEALEKSALPPELKWLRGVDTGASSKTIFFHLCGENYSWQVEASAGRGFDGMTAAPRDGADFGRCYRLLKRFPEWRARLPELAAKLPDTQWPKLVAKWDELTGIYEKGGSVTDAIQCL